MIETCTNFSRHMHRHSAALSTCQSAVLENDQGHHISCPGSSARRSQPEYHRRRSAQKKITRALISAAGHALDKIGIQDVLRAMAAHNCACADTMRTSVTVKAHACTVRHQTCKLNMARSRSGAAAAMWTLKPHVGNCSDATSMCTPEGCTCASLRSAHMHLATRGNCTVHRQLPRLSPPHT